MAALEPKDSPGGISDTPWPSHCPSLPRDGPGCPLCEVVFVWPRDLESEEMGAGGSVFSPRTDRMALVLRQWAQGGARCWAQDRKRQLQDKHKPTWT